MKLNCLTRSRSILLIPLATLILANGAHACSWDDAKCQVNEIINSANNQANQIRDEANNQARKITDDAKTYAVNVAKQAPLDAANIVSNAYLNADNIRAEAIKYVANSADISTAVYGDLVAQAETVYSQSSSTIVNSYNTAIYEVNALEKAAQTAAIHAAGAAALKKDGDKLIALNDKLLHLDREHQAAFNRILNAITSGKIDDQSIGDMQLLAKYFQFYVDRKAPDPRHLNFNNLAGELDFSDAKNIPSEKYKSNFSICLGGNGAKYVGAYLSFCFAMDIKPNANSLKHKMAITTNFGASTGVGLGAGGTLSWSPGTIDDNQGANFGFQAGLVPPVGVAMSWNIPDDSSPMGALPSFTLGIGGGSKINATIDVGGTFIIKKYN